MADIQAQGGRNPSRGVWVPGPRILQAAAEAAGGGAGGGRAAGGAAEELLMAAPVGEPRRAIAA